LFFEQLAWKNMPKFTNAEQSAPSADSDLSVPSLVRETRQQLKLSQAKFAAQLGVSFQTVNRWENGRANPSPLALERLNELLRQMKPEQNTLD
jgi:putative transcriptional regulator